MTLVERPDLSQRVTLSKSALTAFQICPARRWHAKHAYRPWIPKPKMTFGSCVDAGAEVLVKFAAMGEEPDFERAQQAALEVQERDGVEVDQEEVTDALLAFQAVVVPAFDWHLARTQAHIAVTLPEWGDVDGHPDIILPGQVWDVKTSEYPKKTARTLELGFYALIVEEDTGQPVAEVGYLNWVRGKSGYWQGFGPDAIHTRELKSGPNKGQLTEEGHAVPQTYVDDELRRWTRELVSGFVRADRADDLLNAARARQGLPPENYTFVGTPANLAMCLDCQFNPLLGGACTFAPGKMEEGSDAA